MKKKSEKKLSLSKIKIASLSGTSQQMIKAGQKNTVPCNGPTVTTNMIRCDFVTACACPPTHTNCVKIM